MDPPPYSMYSPINGYSNTSTTTSWYAPLMSLIAVFVGQSYIGNSAKLLVLGTLVEMGRRLCFWFMERVRFRGYSYVRRDT